jgi:hypothetical protein
MGMRTGYPLYVVGSSTFGTQGGYVMPGLLMGVLQVGWMSVNAFVATTFIDRCGVIDGENPYGQRPATQGMLPSPCATSRSRDQPHLVKKSKPT